MKLQTEVSPEIMQEMQKCFRNKKPFTWQGKKYLINSGGEIKYKYDTKTWHTDLHLSEIPKK